jgi:DNA-binding PadR family transcriptional regulator
MQYIILGLLRRGQPGHGYALVKSYQRRTGFRISIGHAYRELRRLFAKGWVSPVTNPPGADPRRLPYSITGIGAAAFDSWLAARTSIVPPDCHDELAVRAFFLLGEEPERAQETLDRWREELALHRQRCERARDEAARDTAGRSTELYPLLLTRRLEHADADLAFVDALHTTHRTSHGPAVAETGRVTLIAVQGSNHGPDVRENGKVAPLSHDGRPSRITRHAPPLTS